jgi:hypothetical protein
MRDVNRALLDARLAQLRPLGVTLAACAAALTGAVAVYGLFRALAPYPHAAFPVFKPVAVLGACAAALLVGLALAAGLLLGRLGAWLGAFLWALLNAALPALMVQSRVRGGLPLAAALGLSPWHGAWATTAAALGLLLWSRPVRHWFGRARRLRALPSAELGRLLSGPGLPGDPPIASPRGGPAPWPERDSLTDPTPP